MQTYGDETVPRFDLRTNVSIEQLVEMAKRPFTKAQDLHELSKQQTDLFNIETDCLYVKQIKQQTKNQQND